MLDVARVPLVEAAWRRLWPDGLPRAFVEAFEGAGFEWGGRWRGYVDPMHFQVRE